MIKRETSSYVTCIGFGRLAKCKLAMQHLEYHDVQERLNSYIEVGDLIQLIMTS